jgi:hypothetical protein
MGAGPHLTKPIAPKALIASVNQGLESGFESAADATEGRLYRG